MGLHCIQTSSLRGNGGYRLDLFLIQGERKKKEEEDNRGGNHTVSKFTSLTHSYIHAYRLYTLSLFKKNGRIGYNTIS